MTVVAIAAATVGLFLVANTVSIHAFWPLSLGLVNPICMALFMFVELLLRSISIEEKSRA
jgi:hypothetical protein